MKQNGKQSNTNSRASLAKVRCFPEVHVCVCVFDWFQGTKRVSGSSRLQPRGGRIQQVAPPQAGSSHSFLVALLTAVLEVETDNRKLPENDGDECVTGWLPARLAAATWPSDSCSVASHDPSDARTHWSRAVNRIPAVEVAMPNRELHRA